MRVKLNRRGGKRKSIPAALRSVNTNSTITTILFFYWIGAVSQCALSLCNIIYDTKRPKNYLLCGSTWKCKTFATRTCWKFEGTALRRRSLMPWTKVEKKEPRTVCRQYSRRISPIFYFQSCDSITRYAIVTTVAQLSYMVCCRDYVVVMST